MSRNEDLSSFIASSFRSVWSLELLLLIKREQRAWSRQELVSSLRASDLVVTQAGQSLVAAGLASLDDRGITYQPVSPEVAAMVDRAADLYNRKPDAVRRLIVSSAGGGITAFADAFRLWKD